MALPNKVVCDLANTAIARQKAQLDLVLQLLDDNSDKMVLSYLCLCGAVGHAAALYSHIYRGKTGTQITEARAVDALVQELARTAALITHGSAN